MKKLLIIDGAAVLHRAFHALPPFTAPDGTPTNALHGFIKIQLSLVDRIEPEYLAVAFDTPKPTFRKKLLKTYQAQRPKASEEFKVQVPLVLEFLKLINVPVYMLPGFEADDVIGTIVKKKIKDLHKYIITGDKDILQLVDETTTVVMPKKGVSEMGFYNEQIVVERMGVSPKQIVDFKALVGDSSDNYKGVKGIGPKKAQTLLYKYGNLNSIYEHLDELDSRTRGLLLESKDNAYLSQTLAKIRTDLETDFKLKDCLLDFNTKTEELNNFFDKWSLRSIKKQVERKQKNKQSSVDKSDDNQLSFF
jgi:DNA polymerase I